MKAIKTWLATIATLLCSITTNAYDFEVNGIYYNIISASDLTVEVTSGDNYYSGDVIIPSTINYSGKTMTVTSIGSSAFFSCSELTGITIPNSVTSIEGSAFSNCSGLTSIIIPNSVTIIGYNAFWGCSGLTSITIPSSVTNIMANPFSACDGLVNIAVDSGNAAYDSRDNCNAIIETNSNTLIAGCNNTTIPNSVTSIGGGAFFYCSGLTSITIPNSVTSIEGSAFSNCSGLTSITIPNSVTSIGREAFSNCPELTSITIPNSVTSIGREAFCGCSGLTSITIPNGVTSIGGGAFENTGWWCNQQDDLIYKDGWLIGYKGNRPIFDIVIQDGTEKIANYALAGCSGITSVTIPNSVIIIGEYAFSGCSGLTSITIPNSVTSIGYGAFGSCSGLTSVTIPNSITNLDGVFVGCNAIEKLELNCPTIESWFIGKQSIKEVIIGNSVTSIGNNAFSGCSGLTSVTIGNSVTSIGNSAFSGCSGLTSITIPNSVTSVGEYAFYDCSGLTSVTIPNSVTSIGYGAFWSCSGLTNITIGNSVTSIGNSAFYGCDAIEKLELNCPKIDSWFMNNQSIKEVIIGNSVTSIGNSAFWYCSRLTSITIPNSVTSIGNNAFSGCSELASITIPNSVTSIGESAFSGCDAIEKLELNCPKIDSWFSENQSIKEVIIGNSVTSIGNSAFSGCSGLTSITIPNSVTSIGGNAFSRCSGLTSITIPNSVTNIGEYAFWGCSSLTSITIGNSVTSIGESAFYGCDAIEKLELNCPEIDSWFYSKPSIKEIILGNSVKSIGDNAFSNCEGLTKIEIPNSVTSIGDYAFYDCTGLTSITISNSVTSIGEGAFEGTSWYNNQPDGIVYAGKVLYKYKGTMPKNTDMTIEDGTLGIAGGAFQYCYERLNSITIPNSVTSIGEHAFSDCYALEKIISFIPAEDLFVPNDDAFYGVNKETCTLYVPEDDVSAYESTAGWNEFEHIVEFNPYYTITYRVDGEVYATETIEYGSEIILIDEPVREGYTFSGWSEVPEIMPANDVTVEGSFTVNNYMLTYIIDGSLYKEESIAYGTAITMLEAPERLGYTFDGWDRTLTTMPAEDVVINGTFTKMEEPTHVTITVGSYGSGTFCSDKALDFSAVEGLKAYVAAGYNNITGVVTLMRVNTTQAGVGLFVKGEPGTYEVPVISSSPDNTLNMLVGTLAKTSVDALSSDGLYANYKYTIKSGDAAPLFHRFADGSTLSAGKAYLQIPVAWLPAEAKSIGLRFDEGETTDMEEMESEQSSGVIYDLMGRRVVAPQRGSLYLIDGKKIIY